MAPPSLRVISLVPSITETLLAWGVTPIACTRFCEQPGLISVGGTKDPDLAAIVAMAPDVVVVNDEENRRADADALTEAGIAVHECSPRAIDAVPAQLEQLADRLGCSPRPELLGAPSSNLAPLGVVAFVPIWRRPWMTLSGDTYGASLLASLGVGLVIFEGPDRYPTVVLDDVAAHAPDVVLVPSEPYAFRQRHLADLEVLAPVVAVDGQDLFWWGVRTPVAQQRLHQTISRALGR